LGISWRNTEKISFQTGFNIKCQIGLVNRISESYLAECRD